MKEECLQGAALSHKETEESSEKRLKFTGLCHKLGVEEWRPYARLGVKGEERLEYLQSGERTFGDHR